jgi:hypothetical protein
MDYVAKWSLFPLGIDSFGWANVLIWIKWVGVNRLAWARHFGVKTEKTKLKKKKKKKG